MLSSGKKRYLFIIHELGQNGNAVHSKDIASSLSVKQPSVSKMLNALAEDGLIEKEYTAPQPHAGGRASNKLYTDYLLLFSFFRNSWACLNRTRATMQSYACATCPM
ncbi:MAG: metal-dependent transcriptional regulator [Anaeromassilibacillus sp.]